MFVLTINESGEIEVDTSTPIQRTHTSVEDLVYA
jgi:hypothetical protein